MSKPSWKYNPLADGGISLANQEATARATDQEQRDDEQYANDVNTLAAVFRTERRGHQDDAREFASMLRYVASLMLDGWGSPDALFPQQVFSDHGPGAVLLALRRAYEQPTQAVSDVVVHP